VKTLTPTATLVELLRTLDEARTAWEAGSRGDGVVMMPSAYHEGSYAELELRLTEMRDNGRRPEWWHLSHRHRWGTERQRHVPVRRTRRGPEPVLPGHTELLGVSTVTGNTVLVNVYEWSPRVDERMVERGLAYLLTTMHEGDRWRLQLPVLYLYRALGLPPPDERHPQGHANVGSATGSSALSNSA